MTNQKTLLQRAKNRFTFIINSSLRTFGFGNRIEAVVWDEQYENGRWAYLGDPEEAGHYEAICRMYARYKPGGISLDIGTGHGVLFHHLDRQEVVTKETYLGIDISEKAIEQARALYPGIDFRVVDYDRDEVSGKYDVIIFNETLYYFTSVAATIRKCVKYNLKKGGIFIVSIYDYPGHEKVTEKLLKVCKLIDHEVIDNSRGQSWSVYTLEPIVG